MFFTAYHFAFFRVFIGFFLFFFFLSFYQTINSSFFSFNKINLFLSLIASIFLAVGFYRRIISVFLICSLFFLWYQFFLLSLSLIEGIHFLLVIYLIFILMLFPQGEGLSFQKKNKVSFFYQNRFSFNYFLIAWILVFSLMSLKLYWYLEKSILNILMLSCFALFLLFLFFSFRLIRVYIWWFSLLFVIFLEVVSNQNEILEGSFFVLMFFLYQGEYRFFPFKEKKIWVFFDGFCFICNRCVGFILQEDFEKRIKYAPSQGETLKKSSIDFKDEKKGILVVTSRKIFRGPKGILFLLLTVGGIWQYFFIFSLVPGKIQHIIYYFISRNRYVFFKKRKQCRRPTKEEQFFFLP